jgi:hypothetical protein
LRRRPITLSLFALLLCFCALSLAGCGSDGASSGATSTNEDAAVTGSTGGSTGSASDDHSDKKQDSHADEHSDDDGDHKSEDTVRPNVAERDNTKTPKPGSGKMVPIGAFDALYSTIDGEIKTPRTKAVIVQNQSAYDSLVARQFGGDAPKDDRLKVDFAGGEQVIAVYAPESKRGSRIEVDKVLTNGSRTLVRATLYVPPHDCTASTGHAYIPAQWIVTRKLPAKTSVVVARQSIDC